MCMWWTKSTISFDMFDYELYKFDGHYEDA